MANSFSQSNTKLGKNSASFSREVGPSCPTTCIFLENGCYANKMQKRYNNVQVAYQRNATIDIETFISTIEEYAAKDTIFRLHVGGDFVSPFADEPDVLDKKYIDDLAYCFSVAEQTPTTWLYTHVYDSYIHEKLSPYASVYASINTEENYKEAKDAGFELFAFAIPITQKSQKVEKVPPVLEVYGKNVLVCPHQRRYYDPIDITCSSCNWCVNGKGDIIFLKH